MSAIVTYHIQDDTGLYRIGRYYPRWNLNLESKDKKAIKRFKEGVKSGDYKGHVRLTRAILTPYKTFPDETLLEETNTNFYKEPLATLAHMEDNLYSDEDEDLRIVEEDL